MSYLKDALRIHEWRRNAAFEFEGASGKKCNSLGIGKKWAPLTLSTFYNRPLRFCANWQKKDLRKIQKITKKHCTHYFSLHCFHSAFLSFDSGGLEEGCGGAEEVEEPSSMNVVRFWCARSSIPFIGRSKKPGPRPGDRFCSSQYPLLELITNVKFPPHGECRHSTHFNLQNSNLILNSAV